MTARAAPLALLLLVAALASPLAAADAGTLTAESASYNGGGTQKGTLVAYYLSSALASEPVLAPTQAQPADTSVLGLEVKADRIEALVLEQHFLMLPNGAVEQADPRYDTDAPPERHVLDHAKATLSAQQDAFQLHAMAPHASGAIAYAAKHEAGRFDPYPSLAVGTGKFEPAQGGDVDVRAPASPEFWQLRFDSPLVVHRDQAGLQDITFTGDLVLELTGVTLELSDRDQAVTLESGVFRDEPVPGLALAPEQRNVLLRLFLTGAAVRLTVTGGEPLLFTAGHNLSSAQDGESTLLGVVGTLLRDGEAVTYDGDRVMLGAGNTLAFGAQDPGVFALGVQPTQPVPAATGPGGFSFADGGRDAAVAIVAVLALLAAIALGLLRRATAAPDLRAVEAAIEAQRYGRAARLAKRILRARPGSEDALLGRAIALSKGGRAGAAIAELHAHLAAHPASDGSLHYVLGLAFLDVGRVEDARDALGEAVRLTPALAADVAARLGPEASSTPSPTPVSSKEVHGYA